MKKIIIFDTAIATSNLGDEIILNSIYENMAEIFDQGTAIRLGTHVANYSPLQMLRGGFKIKYAKEADWKFICGTNLITQKMFGRGMINPQWAIGLFNSSLYSNSVLVGVGATGNGEKLDFLARHIYKKIFSTKYIHSVRDEQTKRIIESVGFKAVNTGCPTLWKLTPDFCESIPSKKADNCIVSVSGYDDQRDFDNDKIMLEILEKNYKKCYVWIQTTEDEEYFNMLNTIKNATKIYTLSRYKSILEQGNIDYIGTRLHGGVFALQNNVRSIVVSIDHRAEGFHESNNLPIIQRNDIAKNLEDMIYSELKTEIKLDLSTINKFKSQFA